MYYAQQLIHNTFIRDFTWNFWFAVPCLIVWLFITYVWCKIGDRDQRMANKLRSRMYIGTIIIEDKNE